MDVIDPDMQKHVSGKLVSGERVLWAEKTDQHKRRAWIAKGVKSDKINTPILFFGSVVILYIGFTNFYFKEAKVNQFAEIFMFILFSLFGLATLLAAFLSAKSYFSNQHYTSRRPIGGYVLTNIRLLIFDLNFSLLLSSNADEIQKVKPYNYFEGMFKWRTKLLILSPVGKGVFKYAELYFLHDFKKSEQQINAVIKETQNE